MRETMMAVYLAAVTAADLKWQRIPNKLILIGYLMAGCTRYMTEGMTGVLMGVVTGAMTIAALYIFYLVGAVGAGDVKLFSVIGAACGMAAMWRSAYYALLFAGVAALIFALKRRQLYLRFHLLFSHIITCIRCRKLVSYSALEQEGYLHFAIYISLGYLFTLIFRKELP